jgi:death on curing protein
MKNSASDRPTALLDLARSGLVHDWAVEEYGGAEGIRDLGLVESAVMAPQQTFGGRLLCQSLTEMAATYWYHLTRNHGFLDGNKRVGLLSADTFLLLNGLDLRLPVTEAVALALRVAEGKVTKTELAQVIADNVFELA